jgi:hypothetical protein
MSLSVNDVQTDCESFIKLFADEKFYQDESKGYYYLRYGRKFWVHDAIAVMATKDGHMSNPGTARVTIFAMTNCSPDVVRYWQGYDIETAKAASNRGRSKKSYRK